MTAVYRQHPSNDHFKYIMHACCAFPANEAIIFAVNRNKAVNSVSSAENKRQNYKFSTRLFTGNFQFRFQREYSDTVQPITRNSRAIFKMNNLLEPNA